MADNERIATLEEQVKEIRSGVDKRTDFQQSVMESLGIIKYKQDLFLDYQKNCDAERAAQEKRVTDLENARKVMLMLCGLLAASATFVVNTAQAFVVRH